MCSSAGELHLNPSGKFEPAHVTYGLDVIVRVGWRRQQDHRTMSEIGQELRGLGV
jgi:hypothetical protein